jgi:hypothetical protein
VSLPFGPPIVTRLLQQFFLYRLIKKVNRGADTLMRGGISRSRRQKAANSLRFNSNR